MYISVQIYHWTSNYIYNNCVVTGANNIETHYVDTIPVTQEQPYDSISQRFQNYKTQNAQWNELYIYQEQKCKWNNCWKHSQSKEQIGYKIYFTISCKRNCCTILLFQYISFIVTL